MGSHAAADETIWPTQNDIAQTVGDGNKLLENQWAKPWAAMRSNNYALSGLTVPASSVNLNINVALGTALISGRHITIPGATAVTAAASNTNYLFLKLTRDGSNLVTGASFEVNITAVPPADSIRIATLTASGSAITVASDARTFRDRIETLMSGTTWTCPAGITQIYVEVLGAGGGGGGGGGTGGTSGPAGATGGTGGTTSFDTYSATGGSGGYGGHGNAGSLGAMQGGLHGVGSVALFSTTSRGMAGGSPGNGGSATANPGGPGGDGGYAAGWMDVTPGADYTYAIGSAGSAGAGGVGTGTNAATGGAGRPGQAGVIVIHY